MTPSGLLRVAVCLLACWPSAANAAELTGRVIELRGASPVSEANVSITRLANDRPAIATDTGDEGAFRAAGLVPGQYRIDVSKAGYASSALFMTFQRDAEVVVRLAKGGVISGSVLTDTGAPALDASVIPFVKTPVTSTLTRFGGATRVTERVDDRGRYRLYGLPPGDYAVGVRYTGAGTNTGAGARIIPENRFLTIAVGEQHDNVDLTLTPGQARSIEGRINPVLEGSGAVLVTLTLDEQPGLVVAQTLADKSGRFRFDQIQPGSYDILAAGPFASEINGGFGGLLRGEPHFGRAEVQITDQDAIDISLAMGVGRTIGFRLAGSDSTADVKCGSGATLRLTAMDEWGARMDRAVALGAQSPASVSGLAPGRYSVTLDGVPGSCYYLGDPVLDFAAGTTDSPIMLRMRPAASLEGRLLTEGERKPADYVVLIWPEAPLEPAYFMVLPNSDGVFGVSDRHPGNYRSLVTSLSEWSGSAWKLDTARVLPLELPTGVTKLDLPAPSLRPPG